METIFKKDLAKENRSLSYLSVDGKLIYYKEMIHPYDFVRIYKKEKLIYKFISKITTKTARPFVTFPAKERKITNFQEKEIILIRIRKESQEAQIITKIYKWGKIHIPKNIVEILNIKNHENLTITIISKNKELNFINTKIDLAEIINYDKNVKIIPRWENFITIYYKQKVPISLPRFIEVSSKLVELLFLIHGDGHYKLKLFFVNKCPELHKFVLDEFENIFRLPKIAWRGRILLKNSIYNDSAMEYWQSNLNFKHSQFYNTSGSTLNTDCNGNLRIIIDKTLFSLIFRFVFDKIKNNMGKETSFHALNGLLCAEGGVQVGEIGLHKITLSFSQQEKEMFKRIIHKAGVLDLFNEEQNSRFTIQGWDNLHLFFKTFTSNEIIPFRIHTERRNKAINGFLNHSFTKTMMKYLKAINEKDNFTLDELSKLLKIRKDSILDTLRKYQYNKFIKIDGKGVNKNPFFVSITEEGNKFLNLIARIRKFL